MKKIACVCGSGLGSSLILSMNVTAVLKELGRTDVQVSHYDLGSAWPGFADVIVCGADLYDNCLRFGDVIPLKNIMDKKELKEKLADYISLKSLSN